MQNCVVKNYEKGFEEGQARIGIAVAQNWIWPYAYDLEDLQNKITEGSIGAKVLRMLLPMLRICFRRWLLTRAWVKANT